MWLFIDTSERGKERLAMIGRTGRITVRTRRRPRGSVVETLASFVEPKAVASCEGICVVAGPGSFSAVRSGVLAANLLARLYGKPLYGVSVEESRSLMDLRSRLVQGLLASAPYVAPVYDAEPNITCRVLT
jgi:tRNA A37 threonylcarbamoyladenosine modification protein TsaB